jgi:hypothetical protein
MNTFVPWCICERKSELTKKLEAQGGGTVRYEDPLRPRA